MTTNPLNLNARDQITVAIHAVNQLRMNLSVTDPAQDVLERLHNTLSELQWQIVLDDIRQMAGTINGHVGELRALTAQIGETTAQLQGLSDRIGKVADAVAFVLDTFKQATTLGLLPA